MDTRCCISSLRRGLTLALVLVLAPQAVAQTLKGRAVVQVHPENVTAYEVGTLTLARFSGLAFLDDGEVAEVMGAETLDRSGGKGTYRGYEVLVFEDGSTVVSLIEGRNVPAENSDHVAFEGTYRYIRGTGRFEGIEGGGGHEGIVHVTSGAGGYYDFQGTYSVTSK